VNGQEPFLATGRDANNHKGAKLVILSAKATMDAVSPDIDNWLVIERSVFPAVVFLGPIALKTRADNPAASGPRRTLRAAPISPLEMPLR
jgi:hypothetical protein